MQSWSQSTSRYSILRVYLLSFLFFPAIEALRFRSAANLFMLLKPTKRRRLQYSQDFSLTCQARYACLTSSSETNGAWASNQERSALHQSHSILQVSGGRFAMSMRNPFWLIHVDPLNTYFGKSMSLITLGVIYAIRFINSFENNTCK